MAAVPPLAQIVGSHGNVYESYYKQADPNGSGSIGALDAASFLKKSGLQDTVLSKVWDLSDPTGKGYLEKSGFYVALKLVAMAQNNQDLNMGKLTEGMPPPNLGPVEVVTDSPVMTIGGPNIPWAITAAEITKYDQVFKSLQPVNGLLSGDKVKPVLINSKLPVDVLGQIWELSDIDKDGFLDREEFTLAMHLVYKALEKEPVPKVLPVALIPPLKRKGSVPPGGVPVLPGLANRSSPVQRSGSPSVGVSWVINPAEKASYDVLFKKSDLDLDGFVSGEEIRGVFLQSALPNNVLAHIWNLSDTRGMGKLNSEQFALAMYLIQQKLKGVEPPTALTPEMIPPSMRGTKTHADTASFGVTDGVNAGPYSHVADASAIKELDIISKEIEDMKREKMQIEMDNTQKEADIKIINGEVQTLQKELDAITATLQQLENQKKEAQKRLDELDEKKSNLESNARELREKVDNEMKQINDLRSQLANQEKSVQSQEKELEKLRVELSTLKDEETRLENNVESGKQQLEALVKSQKDLQIQVNQTKTRVQHLEDQQRGIKHSVTSYASSLNGEVSSIFANVNNEDALSTHATVGSSPALSNFSMGSTLDDFKDDPFKNKDPFGSGNDSSQPDPFQSDDPFKENDPFKSQSFVSDPFSSDDPFKSAFEVGGSSSMTKKDDPFASMDPFGSGFGSTSNTVFEPSSTSQSTDAFDPFGMNSSTKPSKPGSLFDSDPFAPKSPAKSSSRKESPAPVLPPKSKKQPPPRPAPPRSRPTPSPSQQPAFGAFDSDPFGGSDPFASTGVTSTNTGSDSFANFADFSPSKFEDSTWGSG